MTDDERKEADRIIDLTVAAVLIAVFVVGVLVGMVIG